jgi:hypothetical protein
MSLNVLPLRGLNDWTRFTLTIGTAPTCRDPVALAAVGAPPCRGV